MSDVDIYPLYAVADLIAKRICLYATLPCNIALAATLGICNACRTAFTVPASRLLRHLLITAARHSRERTQTPCWQLLFASCAGIEHFHCMFAAATGRVHALYVGRVFRIFW